MVIKIAMKIQNGAPEARFLKNMLMKTLKTSSLRCKEVAEIAFGQKKVTQTLRRAKIGKKECCKITSTYYY